MEPINFGQRLKEERARIGKSQAQLAEDLGVAKNTVQNWEHPDKGTPIPADKLSRCAELGMDAQYILTGVRSLNLNQVAEESGTYKEEEPRGVGVLSREEEVVIRLLRDLQPRDRTHAKAVIAALASAAQVGKKDKAG